MARLVRFRVLDGVAVITLDAPPANALGAGLRAGLWEVFSRVDDNPDIKAAVLMASGPMFSGGADLREFGRPPVQPSLPRLCDLIEGCSKPVVAAVHGAVLGGGAEIMLAAHYRLAAGDVRIGLPEVSLGLMPEAGGTQRLPRLVGAELAMQMLVSTNPINADVALRSGLIDRIVKDDLGAGAIAYAQSLIAQEKGPRRSRDNRSAFTDGRGYAAVIAKVRAALAGNPLHAPDRVVDCIEAAALLPFEAGLEFEADAFDRCLAHPQSVALRHVFIAERRIDSALIERDGAKFKPVDPMGKACVMRLRMALRAAADYLVAQGANEDDIDRAMIAYGFRKGPFGTREVGVKNAAIEQRLLGALLVEGAACVEQGAVQRVSDVDVLAVHGLGFPRRMGGPMRAAQTAGLIGVRKQLRDWAEDSEIWAVPELLDEAIKQAAGFDALGSGPINPAPLV